jgi:hypothetical protein
MVRHNGIEIDMKNRIITHLGESKTFGTGPRSFEKVCYFILSGGVTREAAFEHFYADDPNGGPLAGPQIFNTKLAQWQYLFMNRLQLEWRGYVVAGISFYEIVSKHQAIPLQRFSSSRQRNGAGKPIPRVRWNKKTNAGIQS